MLSLRSLASKNCDPTQGVAFEYLCNFVPPFDKTSVLLVFVVFALM